MSSRLRRAGKGELKALQTISQGASPSYRGAGRIC